MQIVCRPLCISDLTLSVSVCPTQMAGYTICPPRAGAMFGLLSIFSVSTGRLGWDWDANYCWLHINGRRCYQW